MLAAEIGMTRPEIGIRQKGHVAHDVNQKQG